MVTLRLTAIATTELNNHPLGSQPLSQSVVVEWCVPKISSISSQLTAIIFILQIGRSWTLAGHIMEGNLQRFLVIQGGSTKDYDVSM